MLHVGWHHSQLVQFFLGCFGYKSLRRPHLSTSSVYRLYLKLKYIVHNNMVDYHGCGRSELSPVDANEFLITWSFSQDTICRGVK